MTAFERYMSQQGKNLTLLIVCGTAVSLVHPATAIAVMSAVCLAVGAPAVADKWAAGQNSTEVSK